MASLCCSASKVELIIPSTTYENTSILGTLRVTGADLGEEVIIVNISTKDASAQGQRMKKSTFSFVACLD